MMTCDFEYNEHTGMYEASLILDGFRVTEEFEEWVPALERYEEFLEAVEEYNFYGSINKD